MCFRKDLIIFLEMLVVQVLREGGEGKLGDSRYKIPLGLCRHAAMTLDSFISDIHEIKEDENLDPEDRQTFEQIVEISGDMLAAIVNMVTKEMGEEEFLSRTVLDADG